MKNLLVTILFGAVVGFGVLYFHGNPSSLGGLSSTTHTESISQVATVSTQLLAANTSRTYAKCTNRSSVGKRLDVHFGATASRNYGFPVWASQSFEITPDNEGQIYGGAITATIFDEVGSTSANYGRVNCVER